MKLKIKSRILILLIALSLPWAVAAQEVAQEGLSSPGKTLELNDCIEIALKNNFDLLMQKEDVARSAATRLGAWSRLLPSASARYSWSHSGDESYNLSETGVTVSDDYYSMGFSASQPLFAGGSNILELKTSMLNFQASETNLHGEQANLVFEVKQAFYSVINASQTVQNVEKSLERAREQWRFVAQRDSLGLADPTEVSQMKVTLAETELSYLQAQNAERQAKENLLSLLAMPLNTELQLLEPDIASKIPKGFEFFLEKALESNPQIKVAELSRLAAKLSKFSSWSDYLPSVNASYSYNWSDTEMPGSFSDIGDEATWSLGISANWSLFTGTSRISQIRSANSSERRADLTLKQARQLISTAVRRAYREMEEASARITLAKARVADAELNATLFREKYKIGNCTLLELLQAELALQNARTESIQATFDYRMALAELERLSGVIIE